MAIPLTPRLLRHYVRDALLYWVVLPGLYLGGGFLAQGLLHLPPLPDFPARRPLSLLLLLAGCGIILAAMQALWRYGGGTPNPKAPPRKLVTRGVYGLCRHPMFLGYDLCALGLTLYLRLTGALLLSFPLFLLWQRRFLAREEARLRRRFGREFEAYARRIPFLLPRLRRGA